MTEIEPPCDCAEQIDGAWVSRCYCSNRDDGERIAAWCAEKNAADRITALEAVVAEALTKVENDRTMWTEEWLIWAQDARAALNTQEPSNDRS